MGNEGNEFWLLIGLGGGGVLLILADWAWSHIEDARKLRRDVRALAERTRVL